MDYTTNYNLGKPEDGARNAGQTMNGNMDIIDAAIDEGIRLLSDVAVGTDLSTVGQTTVYITPTGKVMKPFGFFLKAAGDVGANLAFTAGRSTALTDFISTINGDNLDADGDMIWVQPVPSATPPTIKIYAAGVIFQFDLTVAGNAVAGRIFFYGTLHDA
jgi:hypothetical protein